MEVKGHDQGHKIKNFGMNVKASSYEYTCEIWKPYLL